MVSFAEFLAVEAALDMRWPETAMEPSTDRIAALVDALGEPQRSYPVVHLTGTNGKTSTARMIDALLTEVGLRTGRYTSPHLQRATERINVDNRPVTPERYVELYHEVAPFVDIVDASHGALSKFEVLTAMGFAAFADAPVEAAVIEVGLGGRWDATNVADGDGRRDHPDRPRPRRVPRAPTSLGIAREKSGIIKPGAVAVDRRAGPGGGAGAAGALRRGRGAGGAARAPSSAWCPARSRSAGSGSPCAAFPARSTRSSSRCTASTRRATRRWRWPRWRR